MYAKGILIGGLLSCTAAGPTAETWLVLVRDLRCCAYGLLLHTITICPSVPHHQHMPSHTSIVMVPRVSSYGTTSVIVK